MKKLLALLFAVAMLFSLTACNRGDDNPTSDNSSSPGQSDDSQSSKPANGQYDITDGPYYDLPDNDVDRYTRFVQPFNVLPMAFDDVSELTDETMLFTAAAAAEVDFLASIDEYMAEIELARVEKKVGEYFGSGAALSADYKSKDYSPYVIEGDTLVRYAGGSVGQFFFPYALIKADDGYDLYLADLMDPLFYDVEENRDKLDAGEKIDYKDVEDIALDMQINVYHIVEENGRLVLKSFRYINQKTINHYVF